jgi:hypothetical protein
MEDVELASVTTPVSLSILPASPTRHTLSVKVVYPNSLR